MANANNDDFFYRYDRELENEDRRQAHYQAQLARLRRDRDNLWYVVKVTVAVCVLVLGCAVAIFA